MVKNLPASAANAGDTSSIPGWGRSTAGGYGNPLQYSCLENSKDRTLQNWTQLKRLSTQAHSLDKSFSGGSVVKTPPANTGNTEDLDLIPRWGRSPGVGNGNSIQYSCLGNPMDRGAWWATVHGVAKSRTKVNMTEHLSTHTHHE